MRSLCLLPQPHCIINDSAMDSKVEPEPPVIYRPHCFDLEKLLVWFTWYSPSWKRGGKEKNCYHLFYREMCVCVCVRIHKLFSSWLIVEKWRWGSIFVLLGRKSARRWMKLQKKFVEFYLLLKVLKMWKEYSRRRANLLCLLWSGGKVK